MRFIIMRYYIRGRYSPSFGIVTTILTAVEILRFDIIENCFIRNYQHNNILEYLCKLSTI